MLIVTCLEIQVFYSLFSGKAKGHGYFTWTKWLLQFKSTVKICTLKQQTELQLISDSFKSNYVQALILIIQIQVIFPHHSTQVSFISLYCWLWVLFVTLALLVTPSARPVLVQDHNLFPSLAYCSNIPFGSASVYCYSIQIRKTLCFQTQKN